MQPAGQLIELGEPGADPLDALAGVQEGIEAAFVILEDLPGVQQPGLHPRLAQLEPASPRRGQDLVRLLLARERPGSSCAAKRR